MYQSPQTSTIAYISDLTSKTEYTTIIKFYSNTTNLDWLTSYEFCPSNKRKYSAINLLHKVSNMGNKANHPQKLAKTTIAHNLRHILTGQLIFLRLVIKPLIITVYTNV